MTEFVGRMADLVGRLEKDEPSYITTKAEDETITFLRREGRALIAAMAMQNRRVLLLRSALRRISSQAVCVNMDGPSGNELFLQHILEIADEAVAETANADAPKSVPSVAQSPARRASSKKPSPPQTC